MHIHIKSSYIVCFMPLKHHYQFWFPLSAPRPLVSVQWLRLQIQEVRVVERRNLPGNLARSFLFSHDFSPKDLPAEVFYHHHLMLGVVPVIERS
jgi:hypothetical protein